MSVLISTLPVYTGSASDLRWYIMNNSGETQTFRFSAYPSPFNLTGNSGTSIYSITSSPTYIEDNTGNNFIWPGETLRLDDYSSGNTIFGTNHYFRTDNSAGDAITNTTVIGNEIFVRKANNVFLQGQGHTYDRGGITGGYMLGGASNRIQNCTGNASGIIGGQSNQAVNYNFQNSTIIGGASNSVIGDVQNSSIFGSQSSQIGNTSYGAGVFGGTSNTLNGGSPTILGGYNNTVMSINCSGIYGSRSCSLTGSYEDIGASIWGSWNSTIGVGATLAQIMGGDGNTIAGTSPYSIIFGGSGNTISGKTNVVMVGTSGRTADQDNTTYVEKLKSLGKVAEITDGINSVSNEIGVLIVGKNNTSSQDKYNLILGESNTVTGAGAPGIVGNMVLGTGNNLPTYGISNLVIGSYNSVIQSYNLKIGNNTTIDGSGNLSIGEQSNITGNNSFNFGNYNGASGNNNFTFGNNNANTGTHTFNFGTLNNTSSTYSVAIGGYDNDITGSAGAQGIFVGEDNEITASLPYNSIINGTLNTISGASTKSAIIGGNNSSITGGTNVVMVGTSGRTALYDSTTHVENSHNFKTESFGVINAGSVGGSIDVDCSLGTLFYFTITANTTPNFINWKEGQRIQFWVDNDGTHNVPTATITGGGSVYAKAGNINPTSNQISGYYGTIVNGNLFLDEHLNFQPV